MDCVLILHGWGSSAKKWQGVKEILEKQGYQVFVPDLPGFGENPPPQNPWSIDDYADWVEKFSEKQNLSQIFLLGHSFGGSVAIKYALRFPNKVKRLFLLAPAGIRKKTLKKELLKKTAKLFNKFSFLPYYGFFRKVFYRLIVRKSDYQFTSGIMRETYLKVIQEDLSNLLSEISLPTVIIWGEKDDVLPLSDGYFMNQKIKNSQLVVLSGAKHDLERKTPEILTQKIIEYLK